MTVRFAPALTIDIKIGTQCEITFTRRDESKPALCIVNPGLSQSRLSELRAETRASLSKFRKGLGGGESPVMLSRAVDALRELHGDGKLILFTLFGEAARRDLPGAIALCQEICPSWQGFGFSAGALKPSMIVVKTSASDGIPVDMLPLLNFNLPAAEETYDHLGKVASSFLGYSAIVKREIGTGIPNSTNLENIPRLPIKMFIHRGLTGARRDESWLKTNTYIDCQDAWPDARAPSNETAFSRKLAGYLWEPGIGFSGREREPVDQICHFSCHCDTLKPLASDYELRLQSGKLSGGQKVRLGTLTNELVQLGIDNIDDRRSRPLVFLNACGTGDLDPAGAGSFPELFLKKDLGFIGFIGTETTVPDEFASEFAEVFYEHLLAAIPIGEALHATRWRLLRQSRNPAGILYSLHAEPEIRVRKPVPEFEQTLRHGAAHVEPDDVERVSGIWTRLTQKLGFGSGPVGRDK